MKANELRIGNYIMIAEDSVYYQVDDITRTHLTGIAENIGVWRETHLFEPITLAEKWLIDFGFQLKEHYSWSTAEEVKYNVYSIGELTFNCIQNTWWFHGVLKYQPQYVHQLQNLYFALTGEELTLNTHKNDEY